MSDSNAIRLPPGYFITATGTGVGKTLVSLALTHALTARGLRVAALKPVETGIALDRASRISPDSDAARLAAAAGDPAFATAPGLVRLAIPASPYAAARAAGCAPPALQELAVATAAAAAASQVVLIEGAGGLLVPLGRRHSFADFAQLLGLPMLLVAPNSLGVLSHALTAFEAAQHRRLPIAALVLSELLPPDGQDSDPSRADNAAILQERLPFPVLSFPHCPATPEHLRAAAQTSGLLDLPLAV